MLKGTKAYVQTQFTTVGQGEILIMLYDGALKFLTRAKEKIESKDYAAKGILISKTLDIIHELDGSLNMEAGGEISKNLHQLYFLCSSRLLQANLNMDTTLIDSVIEILSGLRSAYAQIIATPEAQAASSKIASKLAPTSGSTKKAAPLPTMRMPTGVTKGVARSAYTQQAAVGKAPVVTEEEHIAAPTNPTVGGTVSSTPAPQTSFAETLNQMQTQPEKPAPLSDALPTPPPVAPASMASKRLAATARYGKLAIM